MSHPQDRGLRAVRRVREVRERDSRVGLQAARAEETAALAKQDGLGERLAGATMPSSATPGQLLARAAHLHNVGAHLTEAAAQVETAHAIALDAQAHWSADRGRLAAVDHLLEKRAERRRAEAARKAAKEADDIAAQRWLRDHGHHDTDTSGINEAGRTA